MLNSSIRCKPTIARSQGRLLKGPIVTARSSLATAHIGGGGNRGSNSGGNGRGRSDGDSDSSPGDDEMNPCMVVALMAATGAFLASSNMAWAADLVVLPLPSLLSSVKAVEKLFTKYAGKDKKLTLHEATKLFNSEDFKKVATKLGLEAASGNWKVEELTRAFKKADLDHSGHLTKIEFLGLWLGRVAIEYGHHPHLIAEGLLEVIDKDHDGKISAKEIKGVLGLIGVPSIALLVLPDNVGIEYRGVLKQLGGSKGKK